MSAAPAADIDIDELAINTIRTLAMDAVQKANSGHPGTPMALAPLAYTLYTRVMRHNPANAAWPDRDRFVLSCGHASMLLYSLLYLCGYGLELDDLESFRQLGSPCAGHPEYGARARDRGDDRPARPGHLDVRRPGARASACSPPASTATATRSSTTTPSRSPPTATWRRASQSEAGSLAGHLGLGRLIAFYDDNHISIEGDTALAFSEDVGARYEAYGWHVQHLGEDIRSTASRRPRARRWRSRTARR